MSDQNRTDGKSCFINGTVETRDWFERQWAIWPARSNPYRTTNLSFHYGAVQAFREVHGREPAMSDQFKSNVAWLDRNGGKDD